MKYIGLATILFFTYFAIGQELTLDGGAMTIQNNGAVTVQGSVLNKTNGSIDNSGMIFIENDVINNGGNSLFINNSPGSTELNGGNQSLSGTNDVVFYDLLLAGTTSSVKEMFINIEITNDLDLNNQELQLHSNQATVSNSNSNAVLYNDGFVGGDSLGAYLFRATNSANVYEFPVGSNALSPERRTVLVTPQDGGSNTFGVRLAPGDANTDNTGTSFTGATGPFDKTSKEAVIGNLNAAYYHNIVRAVGTSASDIEVLYTSTDGTFNTLAQWKSGQYKNVGFTPGTSSFGSLDESMSKNAVVDFSDDIFVLSEVNIEIKIPGGVSNNDDGFNDLFNIEGLEFYPENEIAIFNRWGDMVFEAKPYLNDWNGNSNVSGTIGGDQSTSGTYFYMLKLDAESDPITGYVELKK